VQPSGTGQHSKEFSADKANSSLRSADNPNVQDPGRFNSFLADALPVTKRDRCGHKADVMIRWANSSSKCALIIGLVDFLLRVELNDVLGTSVVVTICRFDFASDIRHVVVHCF